MISHRSIISTCRELEFSNGILQALMKYPMSRGGSRTNQRRSKMLKRRRHRSSRKLRKRSYRQTRRSVKNLYRRMRGGM